MANVEHTPGPVKVGRFGTSNLYLGPNHRAPAMRFWEAKEAFRQVSRLRSELAAEVAYSKSTGLGDHAKIGRLIGAIAQAEGQAA